MPVKRNWDGHANPDTVGQSRCWDDTLKTSFLSRATFTTDNDNLYTYKPTADKRQVRTNQSESANHKGHAWKNPFTKKEKEKNHHALLPVHSSRNMAQHLRNTGKGKAGLAVLSCKMSSKLQQKCWVNLRKVFLETSLMKDCCSLSRSRQERLWPSAASAGVSHLFVFYHGTTKRAALSRYSDKLTTDDTSTVKAPQRQITKTCIKRISYRNHLLHWKLKLLLEHFSFAREWQEKEFTDFTAKKFNLENELWVMKFFY